MQRSFLNNQRSLSTNKDKNKEFILNNTYLDLNPYEFQTSKQIYNQINLPEIH